MTPGFDEGRRQVLVKLLELDDRFEDLVLSVPLDDQDLVAERLLKHQAASDRLVAWLSAYGAPKALDLSLLIEDVSDDHPVQEQ